MQKRNYSSIHTAIKALPIAFFMVMAFCMDAGASHGDKNTGDDEISPHHPISAEMVAPAEPSMQRGSDGHLRPANIAGLPDRPVFLKIEQGVTFGRVLDQRMSNLHYEGPGGMLAFSRHVQSAHHIAEIGFARASFHYLKPGHEGTIVSNPGFGIRYMQLRRVHLDARPDLFLGARADAYGNARIAPSLGNSFLYSDFVLSLQPKARVEHVMHFLDRDWQFDFSLAFALLGYGVRIPEYGATFQVSEDGGSTLTNTDAFLLHPGNHAQITTGVFLRQSIGGEHNPNWLRVGYAWDYYRISGKYDLDAFHASHQLVLELYFMMN